MNKCGRYRILERERGNVNSENKSGVNSIS